MQSQSSSRVVLVPPVHFQFNEETAKDNAFMQRLQVAPEMICKRAMQEFEAYVAALKAHGVETQVFTPPADPINPDAVFPNNWFSTHDGHTLVLYPMKAPSRQSERLPCFIDRLSKEYNYPHLIDLSAHEQNDRYLEGTGVLIFDRPGKKIYACLSERFDAQVCSVLIDELYKSEVRYWKQQQDTVAATSSDAVSAHPLTLVSSSSSAPSKYQLISFKAFDSRHTPIYHTNVMMALGTKWAVVCLESIEEEKEQDNVRQNLKDSGRIVIDITMEQVTEFCGNVLEVRSSVSSQSDSPSSPSSSASISPASAEGYLVAMSSRAFRAFTESQKQQFRDAGVVDFVHVDLDVIETVGGGGARCMLAELF